MDSGKQFNFSMNTAYLVFTAHNKSVINQILSLALTSWGYTRKKIMLETSHNLDSIVSKSTKWHSNLLLNHTTMYKENKQKYNSSVFLKNFGSSILSDILLPISPGSLPESSILIFLGIIVALLAQWFLFFWVICFTQFIPFICLMFFSRSQPMILRGDTHLVPLKVASALPAIISILLYGASCFAFILHPESNDFKTLN